jgi:diadenosine tetraphosphatase ApaH/serine/threonine PP2A family protein phosphatase
VLDLIRLMSDLLTQERAVLTLYGSFIVVGDIHGNLGTLVRIFDELGYPDSRRFLFLGDYIDRGPHSCEVLLLLYALKVLFPDHIFLLRGNHEIGAMSVTYGFRQECLSRFLPRVYSAFLDSFCRLPVAATINDRFFCVHGGLTPDLTIDSLDKSSEEILWSDPRNDLAGFSVSERGRGFYFGQDAVKSFLTRERLAMIVRSHEHCRTGFDWPFGDDGGCLTVFSSVDYCSEMNDGSVCVICEQCQVEIQRLPYESPKKRRRFLIPSFVLRSLWPDYSEVLDSTFHLAIRITA